MNLDMVIYNQSGNIILDLYKEHRQLSINTKYLPILFFFSEANYEEELYYQDFPDFDNITLENIVAEFITKKVLVYVNESEEKNNTLGIDTLNKSINYYYWANKVFTEEKYNSTYDEFMTLMDKRKSQPNIYKEYPGEKYDLPFPQEIKEDLMTTMLKRESIRYVDPQKKINLQDLSNILYYSNGETAYALDSGIGSAIFKTLATPGGRAASELYFVNFSLSEIPLGIYHYSIKSHNLELIKKGNYRDDFFNICGGQIQLNLANGLLVATERIDRIIWKYQDASAYRSALIETGELAQNIYLTATALKVATGIIGTFRDNMLENLLDIDPALEFGTAIFTLGKKEGLTRFDRPTLEEYREGEK